MFLVRCMLIMLVLLLVLIMDRSVRMSWIVRTWLCRVVVCLNLSVVSVVLTVVVSLLMM